MTQYVLRIQVDQQLTDRLEALRSRWPGGTTQLTDWVRAVLWAFTAEELRQLTCTLERPDGTP